MARAMKTPPVLLIGFKRPDTTRRVLDAIRAAAPERLYFAVDGARPDRPGEADLCAETRALVDTVDWPCEVHRLFRDTNLGCRRGVSGAITWFFENEAEGIVLEDDCVPHPDFFPYAAELLERYRDEPRVMAITSNNFQPDMGDYRESYYFSIFNHVWGWASWRRAWALYDAEAEAFDPAGARKVVDAIAPVPRFTDYWLDRFARTASGEIDTWDYLWLWSCWRAGGLTCTPRVNLVSNIGFGGDATHTHDASSRLANLPVSGLEFPLTHPDAIAARPGFDAVTARQHGFMAQPAGKKLVRRVLRPLEWFGKLLIGRVN